MWSVRLKKVVSFYGISSSTAQNGKHIHPQGKQPPNRSNYSDLINKSKGQRKMMNSQPKGIWVWIISQG